MGLDIFCIQFASLEQRACLSQSVFSQNWIWNFLADQTWPGADEPNKVVTLDISHRLIAAMALCQVSPGRHRYTRRHVHLACHAQSWPTARHEPVTWRLDSRLFYVRIVRRDDVWCLMARQTLQRLYYTTTAAAVTAETLAMMQCCPQTPRGHAPCPPLGVGGDREVLDVVYLLFFVLTFLYLHLSIQSFVWRCLRHVYDLIKYASDFINFRRKPL